MKVSDYIAEFLATKLGVKHVFVLTGGCIIHAIDSVARRKDIHYIPVQHEQSAAMAADAYSRITGNIGVTFSTSGPGATNLLTGTCCSYYDSIPVLSITGQVPADQLKRDSGSRQIGFQETDVVSIFKSVTKYAALIDDPSRIRYELEKAAYIAKSGRPGPVLLDICDDVQRAEIDPEKLESFSVPAQKKDTKPLKQAWAQVKTLLEGSKRPVAVLGGGIRLAGAIEEAKQFVRGLGVPYSLTWAGMDFLPHDDPYFVGGFGVTSGRPGNFAVQNCDLLIAVGTRLDSHEAGPNPRQFARGAKKVVVDIDSSELEKYGPMGMVVDLPICADVRDFFEVANSSPTKIPVRELEPWLEKTSQWKRKYPICPEEYYHQDRVNPYVFMKELSRLSGDEDIILTDCGSNLIWTMQGFESRGKQRIISAFNHSPMGYSFPACIGAALAAGRPVTCITGDGGFHLNVQEMATIQRHQLPIRVFVMDNHGHGIIQGTLNAWLDGRHHAASPEFGLPDPDYAKLAQAYGIKAERIENHLELEDKITKVLSANEPILCQVELLPMNQISPKLLYGRPLEDSHPLLDREEFRDNMIVDPIT